MRERQQLILALLAITLVSVLLTSVANAQNGETEESFTVYTERPEYETGNIVNIFAKATYILPGETITVTDVIVYNILNQTAAEWHNLSIILSDAETEEFVGSFTAIESGTYTVEATATGCPWILHSVFKFICWSSMRNIKIVPEGSTHTGEPLVTDSPADLLLYSVGHSPIENVWLLLVTDEATYNNLDTITTTLGVTVSKSDFKLVTTSWLPPSNPDLPYPGSCVRYQVSAIRDKMDATGDLYFACVHLVDEITTIPISFTLTVNSNGPHIKVLLLGLGRYNRVPTNCVLPFNEGSAYSNSTLVVPELETILLITASFCALGVYTAKRKRK